MMFYSVATLPLVRVLKGMVVGFRAGMLMILFVLAP